MNAKKPHRWAKEIHAFADGETIQYRSTLESAYGKKLLSISESDAHEAAWADTVNPNWNRVCHEFRIKPPIIYPETKMTDNELCGILQFISSQTNIIVAYRAIANAAIRRAIEDGQVKLL